ncbi:MAG: hypothetical protein HKO64_11745 [Xanthomonadales bacterium]|nr:hypothetical protein [Xanthomonadales bacterium]
MKTLNTEVTTRHWLLAGVLVLLVLLSTSDVVDQSASGDFEQLFKRAFVTFALARTLNGVISAVQGTEVAIQPAGVGLTLTPGEILDPVNDLVERFSWIMLGATISLGVQQVLMDVSAWWLMKLLVGLSAAWLLTSLFLTPRQDLKTRTVALRVFIILVFLRFAVPLALIANDALYSVFLQQRYQESSQIVTTAGEDIGRIGTPESDEKNGGRGLLGSISEAMDSTREALDFSEKVNRIKTRAAQIIEHLIWLSVVFVFQTGILPLAFLWGFIRLGTWLIHFDTGKKH